jgi:hypothetical protein
MKKRIIGIVVIALGLLIALGPQFLFKVCPGPIDDIYMKCHWSAQAEIGIGAVIVAFGIALIIFTSAKIQLGLTIGVFLSGVLALLIPHVLIGGCPMHTMDCRKITFPAITVISVLLLIGMAFNAVYLFRKKE